MHAIKQQNVSKNKSKFSYQTQHHKHVQVYKEVSSKNLNNILLLCEFLNSVFYKVLHFGVFFQ